MTNGVVDPSGHKMITRLASGEKVRLVFKHEQAITAYREGSLDVMKKSGQKLNDPLTYGWPVHLKHGPTVLAPRRTTVTLWKVTEKGEELIPGMAMGIAYQSPEDNYERSVGRTYALARLLKTLPMDDAIRILLVYLGRPGAKPVDVWTKETYANLLSRELMEEADDRVWAFHALGENWQTVYRG